jgi:nitrate/nitrite transport system ATP-binding protein
MITHDIDEALFLADRLVMMTNGPNAHIGEILEIPFGRPRNRAQIADDPRYYELRNYALDFLFHRFAHDDDETETEGTTGLSLLTKIIAGITCTAAAALVGLGFYQTFAPKQSSSSQTAIESLVSQDVSKRSMA